jgi:hypothetical protein
MGFDELDGGLGPHRLGDIEPIKTMLKHDRGGLGFSSSSTSSSNNQTGSEDNFRNEVGGEPLKKLGLGIKVVHSKADDDDDDDDDEHRPSSSIRRVTHFPSHSAHEEAEGGISRAKQMQDELDFKRRKNFPPKALSLQQKKERRNRKTLDERLLEKKEKQMRRELCSSFPDGYDDYF